MKCNVCGEVFDRSNLTSVIIHEHDGKEETAAQALGIKGKKVEAGVPEHTEQETDFKTVFQNSKLFKKKEAGIPESGEGCTSKGKIIAQSVNLKKRTHDRPAEETEGDSGSVYEGTARNLLRTPCEDFRATRPVRGKMYVYRFRAAYTYKQPQ